jgi:hypothetical protein
VSPRRPEIQPRWWAMARRMNSLRLMPARAASWVMAASSSSGSLMVVCRTGGTVSLGAVGCFFGDSSMSGSGGFGGPGALGVDDRPIPWAVSVADCWSVAEVFPVRPCWRGYM